MTRAIEFNWMSQLTTQQKEHLNELIRFGCHVRASNHADVRIAITLKGGVIADVCGPQLDDVFGEAYRAAHLALFGRALERQGG